MKLDSNLGFYLKLGWRNVFKYKRRSLQVILIVFAGAFTMSILGGFTAGMLDKYMKEMLENTAHGKIYYKGYYQKQEIAPLELAIHNYTEVVNELHSIDNTISISPTIAAGAVVSYNDNSANLMCQGIKPYSDKEGKEIFTTYKVYQKAIKSGKFFENNNETGIIISSYVAGNLGCELNNKIIIFASDSYGSFNAVELKIIGIYKTGYKDRDENICLLDLSSIQKLVGLEDKVTEISLFFDDIKKADTFKTTAETILRKHELEFYSWKDLLGSLLYAIDMGAWFYGVIYIIFMIVAVVGIMNTVLISIFDRIRDIGTLRSLGFTNNEVSSMIIIEVWIMGILGAVIGTIIGGGLIYYFSVYGIPIPESTKDMVSGSWFAGDKIYTAFKLSYLIWPFIISSIVPVLSAIYPLLLLRKMKVKEALGYV